MLDKNYKALLFFGILYAHDEPYHSAIESLKKRFGVLSFESPPSAWESDHYTDELGHDITRRFIFFENLISQDELKDIKLESCKLEDELRCEGKRSVNLDPGYITKAKLVLATTKDYAHRIYLGDGIFAETTLIFKAGKFQPGMFAYNDYISKESLSLFAKMRGTIS